MLWRMCKNNCDSNMWRSPWNVRLMLLTIHSASRLLNRLLGQIESSRVRKYDRQVHKHSFVIVIIITHAHWISQRSAVQCMRNPHIYQVSKHAFIFRQRILSILREIDEYRTRHRMSNIPKKTRSITVLQIRAQQFHWRLLTPTD